jgi:outer membrane usher protein
MESRVPRDKAQFHWGYILIITTIGLFITFDNLSWGGSEMEDSGQRAILDLVLNEAPAGETTVMMQKGDIAIPVSDLSQAGLHDFAGTRLLLFGKEHVLLSSLPTGLTYQLDEANLTLRITADPKFLPTTSLNFRQARPEDTVYRSDTSAFMNYSVNSYDFQRPEAFGEFGLNYGGHLFSSNLSWRKNEGFVRGLTSFKFNDPDNLRQGHLGDMFATSANLLGGAVFLGGIGLTREFNLNPYFFRFPVPNLSGAVLTPSQYEVYVNDRLLRRGELQPGRFDLANLPAAIGNGTIRVVTRDAYGRTTELSSPYYLSTRILARGQHEYAYHAGLVRPDIVTRSFHYEDPAFIARHRIGVLDSLTLGMRVEGSLTGLSGGPTATTKLPFQLGEIELSLAASTEKGASGHAASIAYFYWGKHFTLGSTLMTMSPEYSNLSLSAPNDRKTWEAFGFLGIPIGSIASVTLQYALGSTRDHGDVSNYGINGNVWLTDRVSLFTSAQQSSSRQSGTDTSMFVGLNMILGQMTNATTFAERREGKTDGGLRIQKAVPAYGTGFGYLANASSNEQRHGDALLQYQGTYGRYEAQHIFAEGQDTTRLTAAGAIVAAGGTIAATRPITDSFAIIQVPGIEGVRGYLFNQEVGRTNRRGDLVVPNMLSYYGNKLSIEDKDIPLGHRIDATQQTVAPPLRGGVVASFPVYRIQAVSGMARILVDGQSMVPQYGALTVETGGTRHESPLGKNGEFYFENIPAGVHSGTIEHEGHRCTVEFEVPKSDESFLKIGTITCAAPAL